MATLVSIMAWLGHRVSGVQNVEIGGTSDGVLKDQAEAFLRTNIVYLWKRFDKSVDALLDRTECARAREAPRLTASGAVEVTISESLCRNHRCNNANFFRSYLPLIRRICDGLDTQERRGIPISEELKRAREEMRLALSDPVRLYDYGNCLRVGDVWMHLESVAGGIQDFVTSNYKESQYLCPIMGLNMKNPY
jgi:hypothetical protein